MYLVINNFYGAELSDVSDKALDIESVDMSTILNRANQVIDDLYDENADLRNRIRGLEEKAKDTSGNAYTEYASTASLIANLNAGLHEAIAFLMSDGRKIAAIKAYRTATRLGLKECKEYVEANFPPPKEKKPTSPCRDCEYRDFSFEAEPCCSCHVNGRPTNFKEITRPLDPSCKTCRHDSGSWNAAPCDTCYWSPKDEDK